MNDLEKFFAGLPKSQYDDRDRYAEFRKVFLGSEEGKRVYNEILSWGGIFRPSITASPVDPYLVASREGQRNVILRLLSVVNTEPKEKPDRARNKK